MIQKIQSGHTNTYGMFSFLQSIIYFEELTESELYPNVPSDLMQNIIHFLN
jgi:hypothetical protein